ncbi:MAG: phospholipase D-like domain-containing protein [Clostridia bacterium]|nr:phospholipase D-like domain-containing protein [Clostridia bacterium]
MQIAYFKNIREKIIRLLDEANSEVLIAMAWFTSRELFEKLLDCRKRGVKVELILLDNAINWMYYAPNFNRLIEAGGIIRIARAEIGQMHHKFCVIDSKNAITGSYNWTYYAERYNKENIILTDEKVIVDSFKDEFEQVAALYESVSECTKLSWEDIENNNFYEDIDFYELNNEISSYVDFYPTAERKVFETTIKQVKIEKAVPQSSIQKPKEECSVSHKTSEIITTSVANRFNPISAYNIGIRAINEYGDDDCFMPIIKKGNKLPKIEKFIFNSFKETRNILECMIYYGNSQKATENQLLKRQIIKEITEERTDEKLQIMIQITLHPNGDLYAEIRCLETGKATEIKATNLNLVTNKS